MQTLLDLPDEVEVNDTLSVHIAPFGDYSQWAEDGTEIVQHITKETIAKMVENFGEPILVDADHSSCFAKGSTKAYAWITAIYEADDGLRGDMQFTECGAKAVASGEYRFVSPVWEVTTDGNPTKLISVALTNTPNLPLNAVGNTQQQPTANNTNNNEENPTMDEIKKLLALADDADEVAIVEAIKALQEQIAKNECEKKEAEAEAFANENADCVEDKEELKNSYLANPELTKKLLANYKKHTPAVAPVQEEKKVCNIANAKTPQADILTMIQGKSPEEVCKIMLENSKLFTTTKED